MKGCPADLLFLIHAGENPKGPCHGDSLVCKLSALVYISKSKVIKYIEKEKVN